MPARDIRASTRIARAMACSVAAMRDTQASIAVKFALTLPFVFALVGGTVDYGMLVRDRERLQVAADAAAKAAALEFTLIDTSKNDISAVARGIVLAMVRADTPESALGVQVLARAQQDPLQVSVDAVQNFKGPFGVLGGIEPKIIVRSVARVVGKLNICVLALEPQADGAIELWTQARLTAQNCAVYSNSTSPTGIKVKNSGRLSATVVCSVGGSDGGKNSFSPEPVSDCPVFDDPLASRASPSFGSCTFNATKLVNQSTTLHPGVYCGGLNVKGSSDVKFAPGIYVIKDGPLFFGDNAIVTGEGVGFFLTGTNAKLDFRTDTTISLAAPVSGAMAGILFQEGRDQPSSTLHVINSDNARTLLGTIYLPRGELKIDANKPIADQSAYTAIVVRSLRLNNGPNLVLNTNHDATDVPVPDGLKGVGQPVVLVQ